MAAAAFAARLELRSGLADLLRSEDPVAREVARIADRLPSTLVMIVVIEGPDRGANVRAAEQIARRLGELPPELVARVIGDVRAERAFFEDHKWLYADLSELAAIRDALAGAIARAKNPLLVELDDEASLAAIADRLRARRAAVDRFPSGFFEGEDGRLVVVLVRPARGAVGQDVGRELRDATLRVLGELRPALDPRVQVSLGGNLIVALAEREALLRDLARASLATLLLVGLAVLVYFGRLRVVALFAVPALIGVAVGYALAAEVWGFVNLSAAFMGSIIAGNGINFAIIQQARYDEERRAGRPAPEAARIAVRATGRATLLAALGAAIAYGSLTLTRFRGFSQFGAIGATGMIAAWLATILVLPALWALFDRGEARRRFPPLPLGRLLGALGLGRRRAPLIVLALGGALAIAAAAVIPGYLADPFEYDLTRLRDRTAAESVAANARIERIFGESVAPPVILAERREDVPRIAAALRERAATPAGRRLISAIRTVDDLVPADQPAKLAVLADLRRILDAPELADVGDPEARRALAALRPPEALRPITTGDLPAPLRELFTERDGTIGRIVFIADFSTVTAYDGHAQLALDELVGEVPLPGGRIARAPVLFAALLRGIVHDAPIATGLSLLGVIVLVALLERSRRGVGLVIGALALGVLWLVGAAAWLDLRVNFLNFIALPISFGVGADYAINMHRRAALEGPGGAGRAARAIAGAIAICSATTIIGYGSLLFADNQALRSFGELAILGELATAAAALTVLPAALLALDRRRRRTAG